MDLKFKTKVEIWLNGKFLFTADAVDILYNQKSKSPKSNLDSSATGTAIDIFKKEITDEEKKAQKEQLKERDYDVFFKKMVKRVNNPEFHIPVDWR